VLSESLSITPRMVEYRIKKLLGSEMLLVRAIINSQKQQGLIFYELEISIDETKRYEVAKRLSEIYARKTLVSTYLGGGCLAGESFCLYSC
jgi:DNA-binding Lrp family transcriptional regulator